MHSSQKASSPIFNESPPEILVSIFNQLKPADLMKARVSRLIKEFIDQTFQNKLLEAPFKKYQIINHLRHEQIPKNYLSLRYFKKTHLHLKKNIPHNFSTVPLLFTQSARLYANEAGFVYKQYHAQKCIGQQLLSYSGEIHYSGKKPPTFHPSLKILSQYSADQYYPHKLKEGMAYLGCNPYYLVRLNLKKPEKPLVDIFALPKALPSQRNIIKIHHSVEETIAYYRDPLGKKLISFNFQTQEIKTAESEQQISKIFFSRQLITLQLENQGEDLNTHYVFFSKIDLKKIGDLRIEKKFRLLKVKDLFLIFLEESSQINSKNKYPKMIWTETLDLSSCQLTQSHREQFYSYSKLLHNPQYKLKEHLGVLIDQDPNQFYADFFFFNHFSPVITSSDRYLLQGLNHKWMVDLSPNQITYLKRAYAPTDQFSPSKNHYSKVTILLKEANRK